MSNNHIIDVDFEENKYYTLEEVCKKSGLTDGEIMFYYKKLNNFLKIQSIGMYQIFSDADIDNLKKVKNLADKGMTIAEIQEYLKKNKQEVLLNKEDKMIDVSFLEFFARILDVQNQKFEVQNKKIDEVININKQLVELINTKFADIKLLGSNQHNVNKSVEETVNKALESNLSDFNAIMDEKLNNFNDSIKKEIKFAYANRDDIKNLRKKRTFKDWFLGRKD